MKLLIASLCLSYLFILSTSTFAGPKNGNHKKVKDSNDHTEFVIDDKDSTPMKAPEPEDLGQFDFEETEINKAKMIGLDDRFNFLFKNSVENNSETCTTNLSEHTNYSYEDFQTGCLTDDTYHYQACMISTGEKLSGYVPSLLHKTCVDKVYGENEKIIEAILKSPFEDKEKTVSLAVKNLKRLNMYIRYKSTYNLIPSYVSLISKTVGLGKIDKCVSQKIHKEKKNIYSAINRCAALSNLKKPFLESYILKATFSNQDQQQFESENFERAMTQLFKFVRSWEMEIVKGVGLSNSERSNYFLKRISVQACYINKKSGKNTCNKISYKRNLRTVKIKCQFLASSSFLKVKVFAKNPFSKYSIRPIQYSHPVGSHKTGETQAYAENLLNKGFCNAK